MSKSLGWTFLLAGLIVAGIGVIQLFVELTVIGLIAASTAALVLLARRSAAKNPDAERVRVI